MNQVLGRQRPRGISAAGLRYWALAFLTVGVVGKGVLQNGMLNLNALSGTELFQLMQTDPNAMTISTIALVCQAIETCAAPLLAFLLVEGYQNTASVQRYIQRVAILGIVSELPYNFAMTGKLLDLGSRNPVFSLVISLVMLWFFSKYPEKGIKNFALKAMAFVGAFLWCAMLRVDQGNCLVILTAMLWAVRKKEDHRAVYGFSGSLLCSVLDLFYMTSTMSFMFIHRYNGEEGDQNRWFNYAFYPVLLLAAGIAAKFV